MHTSSIELAFKRGEKYAKERGIDVDYVKIRINDLFNETLGALAKDIQHQAQHGQQIFEYDDQDRLIRRRVARGVSARTADALTRALTRWADFCGLGSAGQDPAGAGGVTLVQLNMPSDGAAFDGRWQGADEAAALASADAQLEAATKPMNTLSALEPEPTTQEPTTAAPEPTQATIDVVPVPEPTSEKLTGQARRRARVAAAEQVLAELRSVST